MSKVVLVMDTPESCTKCQLCLVISQRKIGVCLGKVGESKVYDYEKGIVPGCPLRELPERADRSKVKTKKTGNFVDGWNACLDVLEGGSGNGEKPDEST